MICASTCCFQFSIWQSMTTTHLLCSISFHHPPASACTLSVQTQLRHALPRPLHEANTAQPLTDRIADVQLASWYWHHQCLASFERFRAHLGAQLGPHPCPVLLAAAGCDLLHHETGFAESCRPGQLREDHVVSHSTSSPPRQLHGMLSALLHSMTGFILLSCLHDQPHTPPGCCPIGAVKLPLQPG